MTQQPLFAPPTYDVQTGDIYALGRHRLMCADATDKAEVSRLFAGDRPTMVVTSPPYAKQRDYDRPIPCWDTMMMGALDGHGFAHDVQVFINLAHYHRQSEVVIFWSQWVNQMRGRGWRFHAQYIWHKTQALPQVVQSRFTPNYEYILHLNFHRSFINKWIPTARANADVSSRTSRQRHKSGEKSKARDAWKKVSEKRIPGSVISSNVVQANESTSHPAQFPAVLPIHLIKSYKQGPHDIVYDPFIGSGTTIHAAEAEGVIGLGCEISPAYVAIALARWNKAHPDTPAHKIASAP